MIEALLVTFLLAATNAAAPVATGNGIQVSQADLDRKIRGAGFRLQTQQYELQRRALHELINAQLLAREAAARGITTDELRAREIDSQIEPPAPAKLEIAYEKVKAQFPGVGREELLARLRTQFQQPKRAEREAKFHRDLWRKYDVKVDLPPPRFRFETPSWVDFTGSANAPVTVVVFSDFECGACRTLSPTLATLRRQYGEDVRLALVNYPLKNHDGARLAALGMVCAQNEGRFWPMYDELFKYRPGADAEWVVEAASSLSVDVEKFRACMQSETSLGRLQKEIAFGEQLGISGTPTLFINGRMIQGAPPAWSLFELIEEELGRAPRAAAVAQGK
jgi:protein-disulfide isomerase